MSQPQTQASFQVTTLDTEELWGSEITVEGTYIFHIDLSLLVDGDEVELRVECENASGTPVYKDEEPSLFFFGKQAIEQVQTEPWYVNTKCKIHIRQNGAAKRTMASFLSLVD